MELQGAMADAPGGRGCDDRRQEDGRGVRIDSMTKMSPLSLPLSSQLKSHRNVQVGPISMSGSPAGTAARMR